MACSRKQGKVLCFCVALNEEGRSRRKEEEAAEETRIVDCLQESNEGEEESERGVKRRELFLCLPPSSASAATPAAYSPRSLISRFLLSLHRTSPTRGGGEGSGFRVRFPIASSNRRRTKERRMTEEEEDEAKVEEPAVTASMEGKGIASGESNLAIDAGKQSDAVSLNLGMGVGLVFLLTRSATEINKMEQLRVQMEILLKDIKDEMHNKGVSSHRAESNNVASSASNSYMEPEAETRSTCATFTRNTARLSMHQMEAEMEVELQRLQCAVGRKLSSLPPHRMLAAENADAPETFHGSFREAYEGGSGSGSGGIQCGVSAHELTRKLNQLVQARQQEGIAELESSFNCTGNSHIGEDDGEVTQVHEEDGGNYRGVSARELERRLHELLETRQRERIAELESALVCAERQLREKESEVCWWRDTARLVSQHKNEAVHR
ncbi:protein POLAR LOCALIZATION DURING ASYMMETRIC DIVISION AND REDISTRIBUTION-like [Musa acuminata AAA Group]|uniref:protein POLAR LOCALIZATION DURING ASYMMETRIC DIVISION AND REDISTRIBUTION-like n=1 Tax=Musa acuminata AAA Group TaxID=214697 RepID=UPI0031DE8ED2